MIKPLLLTLILTTQVHAVDANFFNAMHQVESSGRLGRIVGDNGKSIGPLQIGRAYWIDSKMTGSYEQCNGLAYSKRVVIAYMKRYAGVNPSYEKMARIHNGGPRGHRKNSTLHYWAKFRKELK